MLESKKEYNHFLKKMLEGSRFFSSRKTIHTEITQKELDSLQKEEYEADDDNIRRLEK